MKTSGNTILITGGGSGIGLEIARAFHALGNTIILTGRNKQKLIAASQELENAAYIVSDITQTADIDSLVQAIQQDYPGLNVLINNAGVAFLHNIGDSTEADVFARQEMETNYFGAIRLTNKLLPLLKRQEQAAVMNVSSIVAYAPGLILPTYSASKAALHSYTQALRLSLATHPNVKVFEIMPPLVDTEFTKNVPGNNKISPRQVAEETVQSFADNNYEVRVATAGNLYQNFLAHADKAVLAVNGLPIR